MTACLPWLEAEIALVPPDALVCLGATAATALLGPQVRIGRDRGRPLESPLAKLTLITAHPSSIIRLRDGSERAAALEALVVDLKTVAALLAA